MKDPLATVLLAGGFAVVSLELVPFESQPLSLISAAMLSAGLVGLHRVLGKRAPLFLIGAVVALWVLQHLWDVLPVDTYKLSTEHETLHDAPGFVATIVRVALFAAIPIVARPRIGNGLMVLSLAALAMGVVAKGPVLVTERDSKIFFGAIEHGWLGVATRAVAIVFLVSAFEPKTARLDKRGLVIVAVIGAALFAAVYDTLPEHVEGGSDAYHVLACAAMALAWVLSAIGFAGVARAGGGTPAWIAMGLSIAQVPMLVYGIVVSEQTRDLKGSLGAVMIFGLLAIGIAAVSAPAMGARIARGFAGLLALSSLFGTLVSFALVIGASIIHTRDPFHPLHELAIPLVGNAAVAWAASLAYLVAPPASDFGDKVAA